MESLSNSNDDNNIGENTTSLSIDTMTNNDNNGTTTAILSAADLLDGNTFEQIMKERTRIRREKEEYHIGELRVKINKLEQALMGETKRRIDSVTKIEQTIRNEMEKVQSTLLQQMKEESESIHERLIHLENRLSDLESRWKVDCYQQTKDITSKTNQIQQILQELRISVETERKSRLIREGKLLQRIENHSHVMEEQLDQEQNDRTTSVAEITTTMREQEKMRIQQQKDFEQRLHNELQALQKDLEMETRERKLQDHAIVSALNRYTQQFQQSLSILTEN